jgi:hypothetical protein
MPIAQAAPAANPNRTGQPGRFIHRIAAARRSVRIFFSSVEVWSDEAKPITDGRAALAAENLTWFGCDFSVFRRICG